MVFVYITCADEAEAKKIAQELLKNRLIACANMWPIQSLFWWKDQIIDAEEYILMAKTEKQKYDAIKDEVAKHHSYDVQCVCLIDAEANAPFKKWVKKEID